MQLGPLIEGTHVTLHRWEESPFRFEKPRDNSPGEKKLQIFSEHLNKLNMWIPVTFWAHAEQEWNTMGHHCVKAAALDGEDRKTSLS